MLLVRLLQTLQGYETTNFNCVPLSQQKNLRRTWEIYRGGGNGFSKAHAKSLISDYKLSTFCEVLLGQRLPKGRVRNSDWNADVLFPAQVKYTALDVLASKCCHQKLVSGSGVGSKALSTEPGGKTSSSSDRNSLLCAEASHGTDDGDAVDSGVHLRRTEIKGDIWHFNDRATRQLNDRSDPFSQMLSARLAEFFLQSNQEDIDAVLKHLVESRGLSREEALKVPRQYFKTFIRMQTRDPEEMKVIEGLLDQFEKAETTKGNLVFKPEMAELKSLQGHIDDGCFCDKEGFN